MNVRMGEDNAILFAKVDGLIPSNLSVCIRFYTENIRHGNQLGIWSIFTPHDERLAS